MIVLNLQHEIRSQNDFKHWRERQKDRQHWELLLASALGRSRIPLNTPVAITITRVLGPGQREYDDGNGAGGGCKGLLDALKRIGAIPDDSPKYVRWVFHQDTTRRDQGPCTEVRVFPLVHIEEVHA